MIRSFRSRPAALAVALLAGATVAAGCSSTLEDAATLRWTDGDGVRHVIHFERDEFEDELRALDEVDDDTDDDDNPSSFPIGGAAVWLTNRLYLAAIELLVEERGIEITDDMRAAAEESASGALEALLGVDVFSSMPSSFRQTAIARQSPVDAYLGSVNDAQAPAPTEADARAIYDADPAGVDACASGKEVSHILVETEAEATAIRDELLGGASFASLAEERSTDTGSAAAGGSLGCLVDGQFVAPFQDAANAAPIGEAVGPVQTDFGFHVVLVETYEPSFEHVRDRLLQELQTQFDQQQSRAVQEQIIGPLNELFEAADIDLDPRYGSFSFVEEAGQWLVSAPTAPTPRNQREVSPETDPLLTPLPEAVGA